MYLGITFNLYLKAFGKSFLYLGTHIFCSNVIFYFVWTQQLSRLFQKHKDYINTTKYSILMRLLLTYPLYILFLSLLITGNLKPYLSVER